MLKKESGRKSLDHRIVLTHTPAKHTVAATAEAEAEAGIESIIVAAESTVTIAIDIDITTIVILIRVVIDPRHVAVMAVRMHQHPPHLPLTIQFQHHPERSQPHQPLPLHYGSNNNCTNFNHYTSHNRLMGKALLVSRLPLVHPLMRHRHRHRHHLPLLHPPLTSGAERGVMRMTQMNHRIVRRRDKIEEQVVRHQPLSLSITEQLNHPQLQPHHALHRPMFPLQPLLLHPHLHLHLIVHLLLRHLHLRPLLRPLLHQLQQHPCSTIHPCMAAVV